MKAPSTIQRRLTFLPDPRDGALYMLSDGHIKKLSHSMPELVSYSPCRTADGLLYTGDFFFRFFFSFVKFDENFKNNVRKCLK